MKKIILIVAACLLGLSCFEEGGTGPGPTYPEATSPVNVLKCVEMSFNQRDAVLLDGVLNKSFIFRFHPNDVGGYAPGRSDYKIPETWTEAEFAAAARNMFKAAYSISLAIPTANVGEPGAAETKYEADYINSRLFVMVNDNLGYLADRGYSNFAFERYDAKEGDKLWHLTEWRDNTGYSYDAQTAVIPVSLGLILAMYH